MKCKIDCAGYNTLLQPTDWRYAAAIVGLIRYLEFHNIKYTCLSDIGDRPSEAIVGFDGILYNSEDVTAERYLLFVESFFQSDMTHLSILNALEESEFDNDKIKYIENIIEDIITITSSALPPECEAKRFCNQFLIRLELYKLIKHLLGEKKYEGFKIWW